MSRTTNFASALRQKRSIKNVIIRTGENVVKMYEEIYQNNKSILSLGYSNIFLFIGMTIQ